MLALDNQGNYALFREDDLKLKMRDGESFLNWKSIVDIKHNTYLSILAFFGEKETLLSKLPDPLLKVFAIYYMGRA